MKAELASKKIGEERVLSIETQPDGGPGQNAWLRLRITDQKKNKQIGISVDAREVAAVAKSAIRRN